MIMKEEEGGQFTEWNDRKPQELSVARRLCFNFIQPTERQFVKEFSRNRDEEE